LNEDTEETSAQSNYIVPSLYSRTDLMYHTVKKNENGKLGFCHPSLADGLFHTE